MIRCERCGGEFDEGRGYCPECGKPVAAGAKALTTEAPRTVPMASFGERRDEPDKSRLLIYGALAVVGRCPLGGLASPRRRRGQKRGGEKRAGPVRPGAPDFPADKLLVDF